MSKHNIYADVTRPVDDVIVSIRIQGTGNPSDVAIERLRLLAKNTALKIGKETKEIRGDIVAS